MTIRKRGWCLQDGTYYTSDSERQFMRQIKTSLSQDVKSSKDKCLQTGHEVLTIAKGIKQNRLYNKRDDVSNGTPG
ncbi:hypothetical protein CHS0354_001600 [Potamilus streckersoni]|uniref:Uncharacterized protein n=1 Tax=Potamilus streckersoni TaxID=2493646 RepID=A0AAE0S7C5_9BIVA|nr:hypothetical protein CHS0354_001600 [Potamilus streckersoni]